MADLGYFLSLPQPDTRKMGPCPVVSFPLNAPKPWDPTGRGWPPGSGAPGWWPEFAARFDAIAIELALHRYEWDELAEFPPVPLQNPVYANVEMANAMLRHLYNGMWRDHVHYFPPSGGGGTSGPVGDHQFPLNTTSFKGGAHRSSALWSGGIVIYQDDFTPGAGGYIGLAASFYVEFSGDTESLSASCGLNMGGKTASFAVTPGGTYADQWVDLYLMYLDGDGHPDPAGTLTGWLEYAGGVVDLALTNETLEGVLLVCQSPGKNHDAAGEVNAWVDAVGALVDGFTPDWLLDDDPQFSVYYSSMTAPSHYEYIASDATRARSASVEFPPVWETVDDPVVPEQTIVVDPLDEFQFEDLGDEEGQRVLAWITEVENIVYPHIWAV